MPLTYSVIDAAEAAGATLLFPGNLYNYGSPLPAVIDEATPMHPTSRKGQLRIIIEQRMAEAVERGLRASFGFPGHAVTGREFTAAITRAAGRELALKPMTWWLIHLGRLVVPMCRELSEIAYLWREPHRIDGTKLAAAISDVPHTPLDAAVRDALRDLAIG